MEFNYLVRKNHEFRYLKVLIPENVFVYDEYQIGDEYYEGFSEFFAKYPKTKEDDYLKLVINLETGKVVNWPENNEIDLHTIKVVDSGIYSIMEYIDGSGDNITYKGYVPECVGHGGYGDYLEFEIDADGNIPDWEFTNEDYIEFLNNSDNEYKYDEE